MTLEQIAQQAMDYLDSVGVAAEYEIDSNANRSISIITDDWFFQSVVEISFDRLMSIIKREFPQNPAVILKELYLSAGFDVDERSFNEAIEYLNQNSPN